jgi:uncharacterized protein
MSEQQGPPRGRVSYSEFPMRDAARVRKFYGELFGWQFEDSVEGYMTFTAPGPTYGGFSPEAVPAAESGPIIYLACDGVTATLAQIEAAGGRTLEPSFPLPSDLGHAGQFVDPEGNRMGLWSMAA